VRERRSAAAHYLFHVADGRQDALPLHVLLG
jgi:hypothetical protein